MARVLKALRTKQEVLNQNVLYMRQREAVRKWFKRAAVTKYMRNRSEKLIKEYQCRVKRTLWEAFK